MKRGKADKPIELDHMVSIGQSGEKFSEYPDAFTADKNYYESTSDISSWGEKIDVYGVAKKVRKMLQKQHENRVKNLPQSNVFEQVLKDRYQS